MKISYRNDHSQGLGTLAYIQIYLLKFITEVSHDFCLPHLGLSFNETVATSDEFSALLQVLTGRHRSGICM